MNYIKAIIYLLAITNVKAFANTDRNAVIFFVGEGKSDRTYFESAESLEKIIQVLKEKISEADGSLNKIEALDQADEPTRFSHSSLGDARLFFKQEKAMIACQLKVAEQRGQPSEFRKCEPAQHIYEAWTLPKNRGYLKLLNDVMKEDSEHVNSLYESALRSASR